MKGFFAFLAVVLFIQGTYAGTIFVTSASDANTAGTFRFALGSGGASPNIVFNSRFNLHPLSSYTVASYTGILSINGLGSFINLTDTSTIFPLTFTDVNIHNLTLYGSPPPHPIQAPSLTIAGTLTSTLSMVTVMNSLADGIDLCGGATYILTNVLVEGCRGHGLQSNGGATAISITSSTFGTATAPNDGHGVNIADGACVNITSSFFFSNNRSGVSFNSQPLAVSSISLSTFGFNNTFGNGEAGVFIDASIGAPATVDFVRNTFIGNGYSVNQNGGGIVFQVECDTSLFYNNQFISNNLVPIDFQGAYTGFGGFPLDMDRNTFTNNGGSLANGIGSAIRFSGITTGVTIGGGIVTSSLNLPAYVVLNTTSSLEFTTDSLNNGGFVTGGSSVFCATTTHTHTNLTISNLGMANISGIAVDIQGTVTIMSLSALGLGFDQSLNNAPVTTGFTIVSVLQLLMNQITVSNVLTPFSFGSISTGQITAVTVTAGGTLPISNVFSIGTATSVTISGCIITGNAGVTALSLTTLTGTTIQNNTFSGGSDGIVVSSDFANSFITNNIITDNSGTGLQINVLTTNTPSAIRTNFIANNSLGITVPTGGLIISKNSIFGNSGSFPAGIDVATPGPTFTPNQVFGNPQNAPNITSARSFSGNLNITGFLISITSNPFNIEFYCSAPLSVLAQGTTYIATRSLTTGATNPTSFTTMFPASVCPAGHFITATATSSSGGNVMFTSEFSSPTVVVGISISATASLTPSSSLTNTSLPSATPTPPPASASSTPPPPSASSTQGPASASSTPPPPSASSTPPPPSASSTPPPPSASPTPAPSHLCGNGIVEAGEQCDEGAQPKSFWLAHCCNILSCQFRSAGLTCGNRPVGANVKCVGLPRCANDGVCRLAAVKVGHKCARKRVCNVRGVCVPRPRR